jgi:hypothetical protein
MKICHVYRTEEEIPPRLVHHVEILDEMYPKLRIDLVRDPSASTQHARHARWQLADLVAYIAHRMANR